MSESVAARMASAERLAGENLDCVQALTDEIRSLRAAIPDGFLGRKILLEHCPRGHAWLRADNWPNNSCLKCQNDDLMAIINKLEPPKAPEPAPVATLTAEQLVGRYVGRYPDGYLAARMKNNEMAIYPCQLVSISQDLDIPTAAGITLQEAERLLERSRYFVELETDAVGNRRWLLLPGSLRGPLNVEVR